MPVNFTFSNENNKYYATALDRNPGKFLIGTKTNYQGSIGLFNTSLINTVTYKPEDYESQYGFWAYFIKPTAMCESKGSFFCLNTYDQAKFTFGFMQYAAHVPNGDFVKYLRKLIQLELAPEYFPKLVLKNNFIHYKDSNGSLTQLESNTTVQALQDYLNPTLKNIEFQEQITAARFIHWVINDEAHRKLQVEVAIEHFKTNMAIYSKHYQLNGVPDKVCLVLCDIRHQGRAYDTAIKPALNTNGDHEKAYQNLVNLGVGSYAERIKTLKNGISDLVTQNILGKKVYNQNTGEFE